MTRARLDGFLLVLLGSILFVFLGSVRERASPVSMVDFKAVYYGARCVIQHSDPYKNGEILRVYEAEEGDHPSNPDSLRRVVTLCVNLPTAFVVTIPFAMLPWTPAHLLWMILTAASLIMAAWLMWNLGAGTSPILSGSLICLFLFGSELVLEVGNAAGLATSLCVIAVWCFLKERFVPTGILCFALSLTLKPHVAGPVLLYFLLADSHLRKRALQTLALTVVLSLPVILWVSQVAPHWMQELHSNLAETSARGDFNDPSPAAVDPRIHGAILISLQTVFSIFRDDPHFYNTATYVLCAPLLLVWVLATLRKPFSHENAWLALASIAALSMLPLYHRLHDTRLLLLVFPAFAKLWTRGGLTKWLALLLTGASVVSTDDIPLQLLAILSSHLGESTHGLPGRILTLALTRPVPLIMLVMGTFYLWAYVRHPSAMDVHDV